MTVTHPIKTILALSLSSLLSTGIMADDFDFDEGTDFYLGGGYHSGVYSGTYSEDDVYDFDMVGYQIVIGNYFDNNDAFELRLTKSAFPPRSPFRMWTMNTT